MATKERRDELVQRMTRMGPVAGNWVENLKADKCPLCGSDVDINEFEDELSRKEFELSHMCARCQADIFSED